MPDGATLQFWQPGRRSAPPLLHFAHATGFHAHTYAPLFALLQDIPLAAWDMRGHGHSAAAADPQHFRGWARFARDLTEWLLLQPAPVWLVGHSVGATVSTLVAARHPEKVRGLLLLEPVFLSRRQGWLLRMGRLTRRQVNTPLGAGALRRRALFDSPEQALQAYTGRGAFKTWPAEWLEAYVQHGLVATESGWTLRCTPDWEALCFDRVLASPWEAVRKLKVPVQVHLGELAQSTTNADARRVLSALAPHAEVREWPGASHFLPMEHTAEIAQIIRQAVLGEPERPESA